MVIKPHLYRYVLRCQHSPLRVQDRSSCFTLYINFFSFFFLLCFRNHVNKNILKGCCGFSFLPSQAINQTFYRSSVLVEQKLKYWLFDNHVLSHCPVKRKIKTYKPTKVKKEKKKRKCRMPQNELRIKGYPDEVSYPCHACFNMTKLEKTQECKH